jgi:hypothetical protein
MELRRSSLFVFAYCLLRIQYSKRKSRFLQSDYTRGAAMGNDRDDKQVDRY